MSNLLQSSTKGEKQQLERYIWWSMLKQSIWIVPYSTHTHTNKVKRIRTKAKRKSQKKQSKTSDKNKNNSLKS